MSVQKKPYLKYDTIMDAAKHPKSSVDLDIALAAAVGNPNVSLARIQKLRASSSELNRAIAVRGMIGKPDVPKEWAELLLFDESAMGLGIRPYAARFFRDQPPTPQELRKWGFSQYESRRIAAAEAYASPERHIIPEFVESCVKNEFESHQLWQAIQDACAKETLPVATIKKWIGSDVYALQACGLLAAQNRPEITSDYLYNVLKERNVRRIDHLYKLVGILLGKQNLSLDEIFALTGSDSYVERIVGIYACLNHDDESHASLIEAELHKLMKNDGWSKVRETAATVLGRRPHEPVRSLEPKSRVYAVCAGDVIVTATIPEDADVVNGLFCDGRASKALILDVEGNYHDENVAIRHISQGNIIYEKGQTFVAPRFNPYASRDSVGVFWFFNTKKAAEQYHFY